MISEEWQAIGFSYFRDHALSNGQVCRIEFLYEREKEKSGIISSYFCSFAVADKKRELQMNSAGLSNKLTLKATGKCGFEALLWARDALLEFETILYGKSGTINIYIAGEDSRRFRIYERYLSKYGYKKILHCGKWWLRKTVIKDGEILDYVNMFDELEGAEGLP